MGYTKRQGKQCRERWINFLSPDIKRDPWTPQEDLTLLKRQKEIGNQWAQIAKEIVGRTENQVKNRFNSMLKRIREEKTFKVNMRTDIQEALLNLSNHEEEDNRVELEELWLEEIIQRKKHELNVLSTAPAFTETLKSKYAEEDKNSILKNSVEGNLQKPEIRSKSIVPTQKTDAGVRKAETNENVIVCF